MNTAASTATVGLGEVSASAAIPKARVDLIPLAMVVGLALLALPLIGSPST